MNSRQLQYAVLLSQIRNFSQVAEKLNITQPALSKQILHLENELGIKLFDRNTNPLSLTPAGEYFIREAKELLYKEDQLLSSMERFKSGKSGRLVIGISPFRSLYLIPSIARKVKEKYPGVQIVLNEVSSDILRKEVAEGRYDFAVINLPVDESVLDITPIESDSLVLAVPNAMLQNVHFSGEEKSEIELKDCKDLPFIAVGRNQEMRRLFDKLCAASDFTPEIAMEVVGLTTAFAMTKAGIGATLLPIQFIDNVDLDDSVTLIALKDHLYSRQPAIVTRKDQYISPYAKYAMDLLLGAKE